MSLVIFGEGKRLGVIRYYDKKENRYYDKKENRYTVYHYNSDFSSENVRQVTKVEYELVPGGFIYNSGSDLIFVKFGVSMALNVPKDIRQHWLEYVKGEVHEECV